MFYVLCAYCPYPREGFRWGIWLRPGERCEPSQFRRSLGFLVGLCRGVAFWKKHFLGLRGITHYTNGRKKAATGFCGMCRTESRGKSFKTQAFGFSWTHSSSLQIENYRSQSSWAMNNCRLLPRWLNSPLLAGCFRCFNGTLQRFLLPLTLASQSIFFGQDCRSPAIF